ncbi:hypothetical protein PWT90_01414 [Aphanocladium album]|nr:hypothetical protein PWT90_01414 [Aphanocladium album]
MLYRREEIPQAHENTFEWAWASRLHFAEWLEMQDEGVYWVSGDPGSGKSTLMKHLSGHSITHQSLRKWAGDTELIVAMFFFWFSGTPLQKSQEGLLRSLLFEIFRQCPSAIQAACPARWESSQDYQWEKAELLQTFELLHKQRPSTRFCFFIDGLDEYRGEPGVSSGDKVPWHVSDIISVVEALSSLNYVKLCVSSRPWRAFEQAFGRLAHRKLYVNDENRGDIRLYIRDRFERSEAFSASSCDREELAALAEEMVNDSRGVFIWVFLAVESLLRGLSNEDRPTELRRRLNETPKTLNELFERMLSSVEDVYHEQAAQMLHVALHASSAMYVVVYSFIGDESHDALSAPTRAWTPEQCVAMSKQAAVRITVRCPDLIKICAPSELPTTAQGMTAHKVDFLHRTVRDFLALEDTQKRLNQRLTKEFDPGVFICHGLLTQIKAACVSGGGAWGNDSKLWYVLDDLCFYARQLEQRTGHPQTELLDELQRTIAQQTGKADFILGGNSFMGIMVRMNMCLYIEQKLPRGLESPGIPLLHCALWSDARFKRLLPSVDMINLLLRHGANPNTGQGTGKSIWYEYVTWLYKEDMSEAPRAREVHTSIMQSLLRHGADGGIKCVVGWTEAKPTPHRARGVRYPIYKSVLQIVRHVFEPEERALIEELITERRSSFMSWWRWS